MHSGLKAGLEALIKPLQISIFSDNSERAFHARPVTIIMLTLLLLISAMIAGISLAPQEPQTAMLSQMAHLQHEKTRLNNALSETEAQLSLRDGQIDGLKQEMELMRSDNSSMKKRLEVFDDVLAARKVKGVHFLRPVIAWKEKNILGYKLILVKGENYPRWIKGKLTFSTLDADGNIVLLSTTKAKDSHKIEMTTHAYIEGALAWNKTWQPKTVTVTLINHLGKKSATIEVAVSGNR
ncbi:hypothetical protein MMIC_P0750 [Mariprofundus micogutta]|uniref:Uncharacterized protein n=1 Tax=Mariprofundus micogutta TaxID=1921010 RepID=A0A1L8CLK8_9PROT|nr:hypothetical protein [Mariprofundus micogutta]GAV19792.1 hypothetical protein MMIC_P0750 [Mariprofundus micogutta]